MAVPSEVRSAIEHHMKYLQPIGVSATPAKPSFDPTSSDAEKALTLLEANGLGAYCVIESSRPKRPLIGIHPGGKWVVKRWPAASFAELVEKLKAQWDARVVVLTGPDEPESTERLMSLIADDVICLPPLPIRTVAAVLAKLDAIVVGDGGVMHTSVAVGTPTVGIFGSSEPDVWFPYESFGPFAAAFVELSCRPCHRHECPLEHLNCLKALKPDVVLEKLASVLGKKVGPDDSPSGR